MELPQQLKKNLLTELEFIIKKMREEPDLVKKIYFYSAVHGALERASRFHFDRELLIADAITTVAYNTINDRVRNLRMGELVVPFTENLVDQLMASVSDLKQAVEEDKTLYPALEKTMEVTYMVTGPGFYTRSFLEYAEAQHQKKEE